MIMQNRHRKFLFILILLFIGCSKDTQSTNFEDRFVEDIESACLQLLVNPSDLASIRKRGDAYYKLNQYEKAIKDYSVLIDSGKGDYELFLRRGKCLHALRKFDKALADYNRSIKLSPKNAWGYHRRADLLGALGRYKEGLNDFSIAISMSPTDPAAYTCRGRLYSRQKQDQKALDAFNKAIEIDANHFYSILQRGLYYFKHKQYLKAIEDLEPLENIDPQYLSYQYRERAYTAMAFAHFRLKQYTDIVSDIIGIWDMKKHMDSLYRKIKAAEKPHR